MTYGYDGHGSVRFLTDTNGNVTDTLDYDAFGILVDRTGNTPLNYMYAGEQWDNDLGMYYNRARYLNVATGRFWSQDTYEGNKKDPLSLHKYLYSNNNSVNLLDPSGHSVIGEAIATVNYLTWRVVLPLTPYLKAIRVVAGAVNLIGFIFSEKYRELAIASGNPSDVAAGLVDDFFVVGGSYLAKTIIRSLESFKSITAASTSSSSGTIGRYLFRGTSL